MIEDVCFCYLVLSCCLLPCDTLCMQLCFSITLRDHSLHTRKTLHVFFYRKEMISVDVFPNISGTVGRGGVKADVTCSGKMLQLCSRTSILVNSPTIWCRFWLISTPLLQPNSQKTNRREKLLIFCMLVWLHTSAVN